MIKWSIAGKILDFYDDTDSLGVIQEHGDLEKLGSIQLDEKSVLTSYPDNNFALILEDETGKIHRRFPVTSEDQVKMSVFYLSHTGNRMLPLARNTAARNLVKVASDLELPIPDNVQGWAKQQTANKNFVGYREQMKHASDNYAPEFKSEGLEKQAEDEIPEKTRDGFVAACMARAELVPDDAVKSELRKLATAGVGQDSSKIIKVLKQVDSFYGLGKYASKIGTPEQAVSMTLGDAPETIKVGNTEVPVDDLRKLAKRDDLLKDVFHPGAMHEFMAGPEDVFKALPQETQEFMIKELIPKLEQ